MGLALRPSVAQVARDALLSACVRILFALKHKKIRMLKRMITFTAISAVYTTLINVQGVKKSPVRRLLIMALTIWYSDRYVFFSPNVPRRLQVILSCLTFSWMISPMIKIKRHSNRQRTSMISNDDIYERPTISSSAPTEEDEGEDVSEDPQAALMDENKIQFFIAKFLLKKFQGQLSVEDVRGLFSHLTHICAEGPVIWKGAANGMYVIRKGVLGIYKGGSLLTRLTRGESTGDMSVLCPLADTSTSPLECRIISGPAHLSFIAAEDFESYMCQNVNTLLIYVSTAIGNYWRLVRFVLREHLDISEEHLAFDVLYSIDAKDLDELPQRRIKSGDDIVFAEKSAIYLAKGCCTVNGKVVHSPALIGAASLVAGLLPSKGGGGHMVLRGGKNCSISDVQVQHLCHFHTLVGVAWIMVHDCNLFQRLGLSRHFIPLGRTLPEDCHLLISGRLGANTAGKKGQQEIGAVTLVGMDYLHASTSDVRYVALRDSECVRITKASYRAIIEFDPSTGVRLAHLVHDARLSRHGANTSIVGVLFCPEVSAEQVLEVSRQLQSSSGFNAEVINVATVRRALGERHKDAFTAADDRTYMTDMAAAWLAYHEKSVERLLALTAQLCPATICDLSENLFARFVVHHCDRILLVCTPQSTGVFAAERKCFARRQGSRPPRTELVILHDKSAQLQGTRFLLAPRNDYVEFHHHVVGMDERDFARVRRYILGITTGLVLGGGGARGLAHLGVFKALHERKQEIDFIGGTSQGAFMGACLAGYYRDMDTLTKVVMQLAASLSARTRVLSHATLPIISLAHGHNFTEYIRIAMPTTYIEDLHIPFFCTSANVTTARVMYHHTGLLWKYVRASMTIIGLFPPVWDEGQLLVDGGYLDNLPVLYMRSIVGPQSTIIAVDVENKDASEFEAVSAYEDGLSGSYLFARRLLTAVFGAKPFRHPAQGSLSRQLMYAQHIVQLETCMQTGAIDLYIRPPFLDTVWLADYHKAKQMERRGYLHAREVLDLFYAGFDTGVPSHSTLRNSSPSNKFPKARRASTASSGKEERKRSPVERRLTTQTSASNILQRSARQRRGGRPPERSNTIGHSPPNTTDVVVARSKKRQKLPTTKTLDM